LSVKLENPKNLNTRAFLVEALLILMKEKKIQDISISELCLKAGVSRMGFYRNYNYREDIIIEYLDYLFGNYMKELQKKEILTLYDFAESFFRHFKQHKNFITSLIRSEIQTLLLDSFSRYLQEIDINFSNLNSIDDNISFLQRQFISGGLYQLLISWVKNGCEPEITQMVKIVEGIIIQRS
jgi:AcrR family transcriptional regulator